MHPKLGLACLCLLSCLSTIVPALAQSATDASINKIAQMEVKIFAHPYQSEKLAPRVARLERFVYGQEDSSALNERVNRLTSDVNVGASGVSSISVQQRSQAVALSKAATKYPRITELERQILERTFENEPMTARLSRLEAKVFGNACGQADLAARVDRLAEYAYVSPKVEQLEYAEFLRVSNLRNVSNLRTVSTKPKQVFISVVDEIESLETMAFGKISANKPLAQRVDALEVSFCGAPQSDKDQDLSARVSLLLTKVSNGFNRTGV